MNMGLLNKDNKGKTTSIIDVDTQSIYEMDILFANHISFGHSTSILPEDGLCIISGHGPNNGLYVPTFSMYVNLHGTLYNFSLMLGGFMQRASKYCIHTLSVVKILDPIVTRFDNEGYLWKVDMSETKSFLIEQMKIYNYILMDCDKEEEKLFRQWLGVDLKSVI
jgi:hypothetical protein